MEFRQAKFMGLDLLLPIIQIEMREIDRPKRDDEYYERYLTSVSSPRFCHPFTLGAANAVPFFNDYITHAASNTEQLNLSKSQSHAIHCILP